MEQTAVFAQDVVSPGTHLPYSVAHVPRPAFHQLRFVLWEEVPAHVFKPFRGHGCRNILVPYPSLWRCQVGVTIPGHPCDV